MKNSKKTYLVLTFLAMVVFSLTYCTKDNQVLDLRKDTGNGTGTGSGSTLTSIKVSTAPGIDGVIDAAWANASKLEFSATVPDPSGDLFRGYVGNTVPKVSLRSMYDATNIYFLAEWIDPTQSLLREPWYFDPTAKRWKKESGAPTFTTPVTTPPTAARAAFYEDKVAMLWNVGNSVADWNTSTCYKSCHTGLGANDGHGRHYTTNASEKIDMWHWKSVRGGIPTGQFDDQYQDNTFPNGRKSDVGPGGYSNNTQNLTITGTSITVAVPKYVIPNRTGYNWIMQTEIDDATAKLITAVDTLGVLTYSGGTIDPVADTEFQRKGATVGTKVIPYIYISPYTGSHGDITCKSTYTGTGWILEYKRALKTADVDKQDVDFSTLEDQYFGFAIFENAQIAHAIKPNLLLKFQK